MDTDAERLNRIGERIKQVCPAIKPSVWFYRTFWKRDPKMGLRPHEMWCLLIFLLLPMAAYESIREAMRRVRIRTRHSP